MQITKALGRKSFAWSEYRDLLLAAHQQLGSPIVLVWDNLNVHKDRRMRAFIDAQDWLTAIPDERAFATKGELAKAMVTRTLAAGLPASWVTADEAYGQEWKFRRLLEELGVGYVVAVPKSQQVKSLAGFWRIDELISEAPEDAWQRISCGDGAKGPRVYDWASARLPSISFFDGDTPTHHRWILARRSLTRPEEIAYYFAYAPVTCTVTDLARVAGMRWAIEECFQAAKNECGLDEYEVRRYTGWYRHITLSMLAHALLAGLAADEAAKGAAETTPPAGSPHSPWQRSDGSWTFSGPAPNPATIHEVTH